MQIGHKRLIALSDLKNVVSSWLSASEIKAEWLDILNVGLNKLMTIAPNQYTKTLNQAFGYE